MSVTRLDYYTRLAHDREDLLSRAAQAATRLPARPGRSAALGTSGAGSAFPGSMRDDVIEAVVNVARDLVSPRALGDELRRLVKSYYGDGYDVAVASSCEAGLGVVFDALLTPPQLGRGDPYRARCVGLLERHAEHHLSYGRPFPPHHKEVFSDRGAIAGELGITGRRQLNTDIVMVPMAGARYELHGPKMLPCPLLMDTDSGSTTAALRKAGEIHAADLAGFLTLGYDTPGYGYATKDGNGAPAIQSATGAMAAHLGVPYVVDNAWGIPFLGTDPRQTGADVMLYSMDKVAGAATSGLIIGRELPMVNVRRALGTQSERFGAPSAHGKAAHVGADPGKLALASLVQVLRDLLDRPQRVTAAINQTHEIVLEEHARFPSLRDGIEICKSYNLGGVEINYERSWAAEQPGLPIFSNEDRIANVHLLGQMMSKMGVVVIQAEDGNVLITPGFGTSDRGGNVDAAAMRHVVRSLFIVLDLLCDWTRQSFKAAA